jgi:hypothetical protein
MSDAGKIGVEKRWIKKKEKENIHDNDSDDDRIIRNHNNNSINKFRGGSF